MDPLSGHALDGDSKKRKLILESIAKGSYGLKVDRFSMCAEIIDNSPMIIMQDPLYVGKNFAMLSFWQPK